MSKAKNRKHLASSPVMTLCSTAEFLDRRSSELRQEIDGVNGMIHENAKATIQRLMDGFGDVAPVSLRQIGRTIRISCTYLSMVRTDRARCSPDVHLKLVEMLRNRFADLLCRR